MPKRLDLKKICILGAGPIVIGQACEFDYSGTQACKALKKEGYEIVLINSNPATIMTDPETADQSYIEPLTPACIEQILRKERPCAILPTLGGQTALNLALELDKKGLLKELGIEMLGALPRSIEVAEDRQAFKDLMLSIGLDVAKSTVVHSIQEAEFALEKVGLPAILRPSFTLGGVGGGIVHSASEFKEKVQWALDLSPTNEVLIEESLLGWKEYEMEVIRDQKDRVIIICAIENFDPMGVHTGDSITVAPAQTLTDREYQLMRNASIDVIRAVGVTTGGSNIQFAIDPKQGRMVVIEMNPRVSRSSALASKATGYPIAKIAALLAVGYNLDELANDITQSTTACFEPSLDYVITKIPRFAFEKFPSTDPSLNTQMKSIGEVMAIGSDFGASLLKALRGLEWGSKSLIATDEVKQMDSSTLRHTIITPSPLRLLAVAEGIRRNLELNQIYQWSGIDPWFLNELKELISIETEIAQWQGLALDTIPNQEWSQWKKLGFSDENIAQLLSSTSSPALSSLDVRKARLGYGTKTAFKRIDTCAAEFEAYTPYLYTTYEGECEAYLDHDQTHQVHGSEHKAESYLIIGSGPNRIGQGIEFDYACVKAAQTVSNLGLQSIMLNCNPETVSTDHDTSDRLFFEPIDLESVLDIVELEKPQGVIVQFGGQTPLRLATALAECNVPIIGTTPQVIEAAEDRKSFSLFAEKLGLKLPPHQIAYSPEEAYECSKSLAFPLLLRPSHVLGGRGMKIIYSAEEFDVYLSNFFNADLDKKALPLLIDVFLDGAIEVDVDAICDGKSALIGGIMEQVERVGAHSGDSACWLPSYSLNEAQLSGLKALSKKIALEMGVVGLINIQYAITGPSADDIYVIEVNPRASRTVPFVSKAVGTCLATLATKVMLGQSLKDLGYEQDWQSKGFFCKETVFPFSRFPGEPPQLRPEMRSTGEVMAQGHSPIQAFQRAQLAASNLKVDHKGLGSTLVIDADEWGWSQLIDHTIWTSLPEAVQVIACGDYSVFKSSLKTQQAIGQSLESKFSFTQKVLGQGEADLESIDLALLLYKEPTASQLKNFRSILSEKISYYTTIEGLAAWWSAPWQSWEPLSIQQRITQA